MIRDTGSPYGRFEHYFDPYTANGRRLLEQERKAKEAKGFKPRMNLHEDTVKNLVTATFELPGLKRDEIALDVHEGMLTVSGEVKDEPEETKTGLLVRERLFGRFQRVVPLPQGARPENIAASLNDGVLTVTFPKTASGQSNEAKRIVVN